MSNKLCWTCTKACGLCSWSRDLTPVEGWTAEEVPWVGMLATGPNAPTEFKNHMTYHITKCPEYVLDQTALERRRKKFAPKTTRAVSCRATNVKNGAVRNYQSIESTKEDGFTVSLVHRVISGERKQHKGWRFEKAEVNENV